jgi:hypothetical protein
LLLDQTGDIVFLASKKDIDISKIALKLILMIKGGPLAGYVINSSVFDVPNARILTDDKNYTDKQLKAYYLTIREKVRENIQSELAYIKASNAL